MKRLLFVVALVLGSEVVTGQETEPPTFPVRTEVVLLDMVVRDERGQPVTDLRPEEVVVFEDGVKCPIQSFRLVRAEAPAAKEAPAGSKRAPASGSAGETSPSAAAARAAAAESPLRPNIVILVFDRLGLEAAGAGRRAAVDFARREFPPRTWFAVYEIDDRVRVRQRLTSDAAALVPAIEQATAEPDRSRETGTRPEHDTLTKEALAAALIASGDATGVDAVDPVLAEKIRQAGLVERMQYQAQASMDRLADNLSRQRLGGSALHALLAIARELAGVEGRKTLLLFSEGLHVPAALTELLDTLVSEANRSNLPGEGPQEPPFAIGFLDPDKRALPSLKAA